MCLVSRDEGRSRVTKSVIVRAAWVAGIGFFVGLGLWEFVAPRSFYDALAVYPPFNAHFLRDGGAFNLGIGAGLLAGVHFRDGLTVALIAAAAGSFFHALSHFIDVDLGGKATDPWLLSLFALVVTAGAVARMKEARG